MITVVMNKLKIRVSVDHRYDLLGTSHGYRSGDSTEFADNSIPLIAYFAAVIGRDWIV